MMTRIDRSSLALPLPPSTVPSRGFFERSLFLLLTIFP
jgi:hypothetical protein